MKITLEKVSPSADGETVLLEISISDGSHVQTEKKIISSAQFFEAGLSTNPGKELSTEEFEDISHAAQVTAAVKKGIGLLAFAQNTKKGLYRKLVARGYAKDISEEAADFIESVGYIDEKTQASELALDLAEKKLYGKSRIKSDLFAKDFSPEAIESALDADVDYDEICAERIRKTIGIEVFSESRESRGRAINSLMRYGFSMQNIRRALEIIMEEI